MSETLQTGAGMGMEHPDAEQLTAFAEQAMPAWEREQVLGHLAGCAACRQVVFVAQAGMPEVEEVAAVPERPRRCWFGGWGLAWAGAAGVLAGAVVLTVHLVRVERRPQDKVSTASVREEQPVAVAHGPAEAKVVPAETMHGAPAEKARRTPAVAGVVGGLTARDVAPVPTPAATALPAPAIAGQMQGERQSVGLGGAAPIVAPAGGAIPAAGLASVHGASVPSVRVVPPLGQVQTAPVAMAKVPVPIENQPAPEQRVQVQAAQRYAAQSGLQTGGAFGQGQTAGAGQAVATQQIQAMPPPAAAPAAAMSQAAPQGQMGRNQQAATNEVIVTSAADVAALATADVAPEAVFSLPSHLPTISAIERQSQVLAIDSQGAVFLSRDKGRHWTAVTQVWSGRPVQVGFVDGGSTSANDRLRSATAAAPKPGLPVNEGFDVMHGAVAGPGAEFTGVVEDETGAVIANAGLRLTRSDGSGGYTARTDASGRWALEGVVAGRYRAQVEARGFIAEAREMQVKAGDRVTWRVRLRAGAASEAVTVNGALPELSAERVRRAEAFFELRTDTGVVWTSPDGVSWRRR